MANLALMSSIGAALGLLISAFCKDIQQAQQIVREKNKYE